MLQSVTEHIKYKVHKIYLLLHDTFNYQIVLTMMHKAVDHGKICNSTAFIFMLLS